MQQTRKYSGIIIGATGAVGTQLVIELLKSEKWSKILTLTRRDYTLPVETGIDTEKEVSDGRLVKKIVNFENLEKEKNDFCGYDYMFSCFGTTKGDAGSSEAFMHIDHDYNVNAAKIAKEVGIKHYGLLSAVGSSAGSWLLYPRCKGLIEQHLKELQFDSLSIFYPSLLNRGNMSRWNESIFLWIAPSIPVEKVAHAMRIQAELALETEYEKPKVFSVSNKEMKECQ